MMTIIPPLMNIKFPKHAKIVIIKITITLEKTTELENIKIKKKDIASLPNSTKRSKTSKKVYKPLQNN